MKIHITTKRMEQGYALLLVMVMLAVMLLLLASNMNLATSETKMTARNNFHTAALAAAEASTEAVITHMNSDFKNQCVNSDLTHYQGFTADAFQGNWPMQFQFSDAAGNLDKSGVVNLSTSISTNIDTQFAGLYGAVATYRITSQATVKNRVYQVSAAVAQDIQLASIPIFQFAIFYTLNLEINPGPNMTVTGKVHSNGNIYAAPVSTLTFNDYVTFANSLFNNRDPNDPQYGSSKTAPVYAYDGTNGKPSQVSSLTLPISTDNSSASVHQILEPPPSGGETNSVLAQARYYNKADLIVTTTTSGVRVTTGAWNNFGVVNYNITNNGVPGYTWINTSKTFKDQRENKTVITTEIDVAALKTWMGNTNSGSWVNQHVKELLGHDIDSIYIDDQRPVSSTTLTAVRVVNGASLPNSGLTLATQLPLYVFGNYNLNNGDTTVGQTDTSKTKPASLISDAITILSTSWNDTKSSGNLSGRSAGNTTVNAAFLTGIVETTNRFGGKQYSGGLENLPRLLEDWSNDTLTYNGSMVVMFASKYATGYWSGNYYSPPTRKWAFDVNFLQQGKLPPCTPQVRKIIRSEWQMVATR